MSDLPNGAPGTSNLLVNVKNTFLEVGVQRKGDYRRNNTVPIQLILSDSPSTSVERDDQTFTTRLIDTLIWIDERAFKDSGTALKADLSRFCSNGQVKCYKSVDKFMRAYERKIAAAKERDISVDRIVLVIHERHLADLEAALGSTELVSARIIECDANEECSSSRDDHTSKCRGWDCVLDAIRRISHR